MLIPIILLLLLAAAFFWWRRRARVRPATEQPQPPLATGGKPRAAGLTIAQSLSEAAHRAASLGEALTGVGAVLAHHLEARAVTRLWIDGWNGETALVRHWPQAETVWADHIDVSALWSAGRSGCPAREAIATQKPVLRELAPSEGAGTDWRPDWAERAVSLPVALSGQPRAVLELYDPRHEPDELLALLDVARVQLGLVAEREAAQAQFETHAEQLSRLAQVAKRIASGVAIVDRDGVVEWVNPAFTEVTGWQPEALLGHTLCRVLERDGADAPACEQLRVALRRGEVFRLEYEALRQAGAANSRYWGEIDAIQMVDEGGGAPQLLCLFTDITLRRQREHQIQQSHEHLEALAENLPVSLFVLDPEDFRIVSINRYAEAEFGVARDRVVGSTVEAALGRPVLRSTEPAMRQAIDGRTTVEHDFVFAAPNGDRLINARHFALRHADGRPRLLISLVRDITERRKAQLDLMESELRFRELVESMDDCVFVTTPERDRMFYLGPRTHDIWGLREQDVQADPQLLMRLVLPEDRHLLDHRRDLEERLEPTDISFRIRHPDGGIRWLRQRTRAQQLPSGEVHVYGLTSDITAEREHELQLSRARDAAEAASQAKSQFMANMSHEIRTPMNGILGMTELLLGTTLNDKQRRFAQAVYRSGESLLEIINDILDFAKIEAGRLELAPTDFVLRSVVEDTLELLAQRAHEKGIELSFHELPGLPAWVNGDPLRLRQVLTNLVANAIKFTESGEVVVDVRCIEHQGEHTLVRFEVRDTGIGITEDVLPRLFNAFTQANGGMARRYGGTGLGLAISKQLVELMGGTIEVRSSPGVGSVFGFSIPLRSVALDSDQGEFDAAGMPALHALVVEDNETNRTVLENMLGAWGMRVTLARDGLHALEILHGEHGPVEPPFDLALVDMNMPRLDGLGFARAVTQDGRYGRLKLVMLSSVSSPDDARRAQDAGFHRFVAKPLRKAELRQAILGVSVPRTEGVALTPRLNRHILVIEDNPVNQEVIGQMLRRLGCRVQVAGSALEGLRALCEKKFDLVLMDIQMPGMDGVEALGWFRKGPGGRFPFVTPPHTPVVAVTANALGGDEERFLALGFDDYLSKPFRQSQLLGMLTKRLPHAESAAEGGESSSSGGAPAAPVPRSGADTGVLDAQALQRLRELDPTGENQLMDRVLKAFDNSVARLVPQLVESQQTGDLTGVRHVAHTLKSSSASIGAIKLSQICAEIEYMIRQGTSTDLEARVDAMRAEIELVLDSLRALLEAR